MGPSNNGPDNVSSNTPLMRDGNNSAGSDTPSAQSLQEHGDVPEKPQKQAQHVRQQPMDLAIEIVTDCVFALVAIMFIAYGITVAQYNGRPVLEHRKLTEVLTDATNLVSIPYLRTCLRHMLTTA